MSHFFCKSLIINIFSRPKRPYKGQLVDLLAFVQKMLLNIILDLLKSYQNFLKKRSKILVSRPAASDLTLTFVINFQKNFLSELYQIQIMWLFLPKLSLHEKNLAFKGQEGQERSCNFLFQNFWELRLVQI